MPANHKMNGRATSIPVGLAYGLGISVAFTLLVITISAYMISEELLTQAHIGYCAIVALLVASYLGAKTASGKIKRHRLQMCLLSGGIYFLTLVGITAVFLKGEYSGVGVTLFVVLSGAILGAITGETGKKTGKQKMPKNYHW